MAKFKYIGKTDISEGDVRTYEGKYIPASGLIEFEQEFFIEKAKRNVNYEEVIKEEPENRDDGEEIREYAKMLGISNYWNKKIDNLIAEIEELEGIKN